MAFSITNVDGDDNVFDGQTNVVVTCVDAGTTEGPVTYGGVPQLNPVWAGTTITVPVIDATGLDVDQQHTFAAYKPIVEGEVEPPGTGTQFYVRSNSANYGIGDGSDWDNAWSGMAGINYAAVSGGDQIWIAGGEYSDRLTPAGQYSATDRLWIRRALSTSVDCTGKAGWQAGFSSTIHHTDMISGTSSISYIVFSGRTEANANGWHIDRKGDTSGLGIGLWNDSNFNYNIWEYFEIEGPGFITYSGDGRGIDATPFSSSSGNIFRNMEIYDWESSIYLAGMDDTIIEHIDIHDLGAVNWPAYHPNGIYMVAADNTTIRYSTFRKVVRGTGEGIFVEQSGGVSNLKIYGNVFIDLEDTGTKAVEMTAVVNGLEVYNNTFINVLSPWYTSDGGGFGTGGAWRNNLVVDSGGVPGSGATITNNIKIGSFGAPGTPDPFVDRAGRDLHIVATTGTDYPKDAGVALAAEFNTDQDGVTRGADGTWDIGAYEYPVGGNT